MTDTYIYALDLSLNSTGICIFTNDGRFVEAMTIDTHREDNTQLKLKKIGDAFLNLIKKYKPNKVIIEQGFTRFHKSTQALFRVHGVANYIFWEYEQIYYPSTTIKKIVGGKGNMGKKQLREVIKMEHPDVSFESYDESDAFATGKTYFIEQRSPKDA